MRIAKVAEALHRAAVWSPWLQLCGTRRSAQFGFCKIGAPLPITIASAAARARTARDLPMPVPPMTPRHIGNTATAFEFKKGTTHSALCLTAKYSAIHSAYLARQSGHRGLSHLFPGRIDRDQAVAARRVLGDARQPAGRLSRRAAAGARTILGQVAAQRRRPPAAGAAAGGDRLSAAAAVRPAAGRSARFSPSISASSSLSAGPARRWPAR